MTVDMEVIGVVGLGKLGSSLMAALLYRGYKVVGVDSDPAVVSAMNSKLPAPLSYEPEVSEILHAHAKDFAVSGDYSILGGASIFFVTVPTPSTDDGRYDVTYVVDAFSNIAVMLNSAPMDDRLLVLQSTVMPGDMRKFVIPAFEMLAAADVAAGVSICYNPEFIALGSVVQDILHPNTILIGGYDVLAGPILESFYSEFLPDAPAPNVMSLGSAEMAKLCLNTMITAKVTMANLIGLLCERVHDGDAFDVTKAIGDDPRIGNLYFKPGLPYGGPCFPRDNRALTAFMYEVDLISDIPKEVDSLNRDMLGLYRRASLWNVLDIATEYFGRGLFVDSEDLASLSLRISVIGLAYKDNTPVIEESAAVSLAVAAAAEIVCNSGKLRDQLCLCDPLVSDEALLEVISGGFRREADPRQAVLYGDVVLLTGAGLCGRMLSDVGDDSDIIKLLEGKVVVDYWRVVPRSCWGSDKFVYIAPGIDPGIVDKMAEHFPGLWR